MGLKIALKDVINLGTICENISYFNRRKESFFIRKGPHPMDCKKRSLGIGFNEISKKRKYKIHGEAIIPKNNRFFRLPRNFHDDSAREISPMRCCSCI